MENPILIRKNATYAVFTPQLWLNKPTIEALFGPSPDLAHLIRSGQWTGAESLRYAVDALRRRGAAMGGMMTWDFNEPWPNGAGSFQIDHDGRPLLNHAFMRQAAAPLALSLRYETSLFEAGKPLQATLFITNDSGKPASDLRWSWKARDRRGGVIDSGEGVVSVADLEVKQLADISVSPEAKVGLGPVLIEVQLRDADNQIVGERLHVFGLAGVKAPLRGLLDHSITDTDDDTNLPLVQGGQPELFRPIARTTLQVALGKHRIEREEEVLEIKVSNTGTMTALFCEPQPVLSYRTDLWIEGRHVSIPPGESRTFTIRAPSAGPDQLSLLQTGWRVQSWNSEDAIIAPAALAAVGTQDSMRREFGGYDQNSAENHSKETKLDGRSPEAAMLPGLFETGDQLFWNLELPEAAMASSLRLHTSDQSVDGATFDVLVNGKTFTAAFPHGYGLQKDDPAHLARPHSVIIPLPPGTLKAGANSIRITNSGKGWITWDAIHLLTNP